MNGRLRPPDFFRQGLKSKRDSTKQQERLKVLTAKTMNLLQLKAVDDEFFTRSSSGAIWGRVYFELGDETFPDNGWTDMITAFSEAWLEALIRIAAGSENEARVWFMDGPFAVDLLVHANGLLKVRFLHKEAVTQSVEASVRDLLENAIDISKQVLASCQKRQWINGDVSNLEKSVKRGVESLRALKGHT